MNPQREKERAYLNELSRVILDACIEVHSAMGPGLLESVYHECLLIEFSLRGISTRANVQIPLQYKEVPLHRKYVIDLLVEDKIILEIKAVDKLLPIHSAQIISYLKLANRRLGFLVNFNADLIKNGFNRFVNNF